MTYVKCVNNKAYIRFKDQPLPDEKLIDLTVGHVYKALPDSDASHSSTIRVIDNSGKDYLYPASYFQPLDFSNSSKELSDSFTLHLNHLSKAILRAEALAEGVSMSALVRSWIDQRLHIPSY